ncbi:MAG: hypothetical protein M1827_000828 [Pycnora praestabilis]|nr:MAG: hypothetical protein M1827_000828 [Pycnora praestabilis]
MHMLCGWILALGVATANAFQDTSPFFYFSTSESSFSSQSISQLQTASSLTQDIQSSLFECPSDTYIIASQPGVNAADFASRLAAPHLRRRISKEDSDVKSSFSVAEVVGDFGTEELQMMLEQRCRAGVTSVDASTGSFGMIDDMRPRIIRVEFPNLPSAQPKRASKLAENDAFLSSIIDLLPTTKYTVIYATSPVSETQRAALHEVKTYEMEETFPSAIHTDLKRDFSIHSRAAGSNETLVDGPLFERYQFFTPGIFMGLVVGFVLLSILYVGVTGVASLQVSYAAFEKDMGPAAQKKQQ